MLYKCKAGFLYYLIQVRWKYCEYCYICIRFAHSWTFKRSWYYKGSELSSVGWLPMGQMSSYCTRNCSILIGLVSTLSEQIVHSTVDLHPKEISESLHGSVMNKVTPELASQHTCIKFSRYVYDPLSQLLLRV